MKIKRYEFHLSPLKPFIFEEMTVPVFSKPMLPFHDIHEPLHLAYLYTGQLNSYVAGDCYLVPPWFPHQASKSDTGCILGMVTLMPEILLPCFFDRQDELRRLLLCPPRQMRLVMSRENIRQAAAKCFAGLRENRHNLSLQFASIITFFARLLEENIDDIVLPFSLAEYRSLSPAVHYIRRMQSGSLREAAAAELCHMSECTFSRRFHKVFNEKFSAFELRYRITQAARDILEPGVSVKQIAEKWDFYDSSHFVRTFRKYFAVSPGKFASATAGAAQVD